MNKYGYASEGESFSIADPHEAWVMEIIGKGEYELGAVWVAMKLPDGAVCAHANQARITTFPLNDKENCLYASDTITFAKKIGIYEGDDSSFSFSDVYDPVTFGGARFCEARVWSFFGSLMGSEWASAYAGYAMGTNLTNRMPLFVVPPDGAKVSVQQTMQYMRSHYENSVLDMAGQSFSDVGAVDAATPFRGHPLTWSSSVDPTTGQPLTDGSVLSFLHERPIATPQTGWNFVAQSRSWMPRQLAGLLWFGVDDSSTTVRFPIYGSATKVPPSFAGQGAQDGVTPPVMSFSMHTAFGVFNLVANWAYPRWNLLYPELLQEITRRESAYLLAVEQLDVAAVQVLNQQGVAAAVQLVTDYSVAAGDQLVRDWGDLFGELFVRFRDGYVVAKADSKVSPACGCDPSGAGAPQQWYDRIVQENGQHYLYDDSEDEVAMAKRKFRPVSKVQLLARR